MGWISTASSKHFNYENPAADSIDINDIALALSQTCRFAGHITPFYSVAQHSLFVSQIAPPQFALEGLLHDAAEAYCCDIPSPLKALLPDYKVIESRVQAVICKKFGIPVLTTTAIKAYDMVALATEKRDLKIDVGVNWPILEGIKPLAFPIIHRSPDTVRQLFLSRFYELTGEKMMSDISINSELDGLLSNLYHWRDCALLTSEQSTILHVSHLDTIIKRLEGNNDKLYPSILPCDVKLEHESGGGMRIGKDCSTDLLLRALSNRAAYEEEQSKLTCTQKTRQRNRMERLMMLTQRG